MEQPKKYLGQAAQDYFVINVLKQKRNGWFVEIGSSDPAFINNTFILEKYLDWKGIMVEYDAGYLPMYQAYRPNSKHYMSDATKLNFKEILDTNNFPRSIDYLQLDLEADNRSTLTVLEHFDANVFPTYTFAVITFEHDFYRGDFHETRRISREIFEKHGYLRVFSDVSASNKEYPNPMPFEDWYVHPSLVDMNYIEKIKRNESLPYQVIEEILDLARMM